ncbi:MAG: ribosome hibernation-promoting factor, HPF/YfiA family [Planctomycetia bacterium]
MEVKISSRHGEIHGDAYTYIEKKLPKLNHIFERLLSIQVTVDFQKHEPEVELLVSAEHKHDFVSREHHPTVTSAFDNALAKMEGQLRKYKEKIQNHRRTPMGGDPNGTTAADTEPVEAFDDGDGSSEER